MKQKHGSTVARLAALAAVIALAAGCGGKMIKGTQIEDTERARSVIRVVEAYRTSVENRDAQMLAAVVSPNYFEKNGDNNSRNNYDFQGLVNFLQSEDFRRVSAVRMTIVYRRIDFDEDERTATVTYNYTANFKMPPPTYSEQPASVGEATKMADDFDRELWFSRSDSNQIVMEKLDGKWYIVKGL